MILFCPSGMSYLSCGQSRFILLPSLIMTSAESKVEQRASDPSEPGDPSHSRCAFDGPACQNLYREKLLEGQSYVLTLTLQWDSTWVWSMEETHRRLKVEGEGCRCISFPRVLFSKPNLMTVGCLHTTAPLVTPSVIVLWLQ